MNKLLLVILLTIIIIVIIFVLIIAPRIKRFSKIFNLNHYHEIYQNIDDIKKAAIKSIPGDADDTPIKRDDPRSLWTSGGLAIIYTITKADNEYEHHFSISMPGRYTPHAVGEHFSLFVADIMSWKIKDTIFFFTETPIYHADLEFQLEEQLSWEKMQIKPKIESRDEIRERFEKLSKEVEFHSVVLSEKDNSDTS